MNLDEIEKLARKIGLVHEAEKARAYMHDYPLRETDASILARALLAVLPVVRMVNEWRDSGDGQGHCEEEGCRCSTQRLREALDTMRQRLGGAE